MIQKGIYWPILLRFGFFVLNLYFTIRITVDSGWNFFSIILAMFATREFVGTIQMGQVYSQVKKRLNEKNDQNNN